MNPACKQRIEEIYPGLDFHQLDSFSKGFIRSHGFALSKLCRRNKTPTLYWSFATRRAAPVSSRMCMPVFARSTM